MFCYCLDSRLRGNDDARRGGLLPVIPAKAGIQETLPGLIEMLHDNCYLKRFLARSCTGSIITFFGIRQEILW